MVGRSRNIIRGGGARVSLITSSRTTILHFVSHKTKLIFMFSRFSTKIEVVQNVKNITLVPFGKTECFDYILAS